MDEDEARPRPQVGTPPLDRMGVAELQAYVAGLRQEIGRAEAEMARKQAMRHEADGFFRPQG